jgi:hypothetical protein
MRLLFISFIFSSLLPAQSLTGRWDLTIVAPDATFPSWLEVTQKESAPAVRIGGRVASVHPAREVKVEGSRLTFVTNEHFGKAVVVDWEITEKDGNLTGVQKRSDGIVAKLTGERAPALDRPMPAKWKAPEPLFNGKDLTGWEPLVTEQGKSPVNNWKAINGELVNQAAGANIRTTRTFQDFKLHVEFNCPQNGNSGVYLRGRYEVQVEYEPVDQNDPLHGMGSAGSVAERSTHKGTGRDADYRFRIPVEAARLCTASPTVATNTASETEGIPVFANKPTQPLHPTLPG